MRDSGNGFSFANYSSNDMLHVIRDAVALYKDSPDAFARLRQRAMSGDFSWAKSAKEYLRIYAGVTGEVWPAVPAESEDARPFEESTPAKKPRKTTAKKTVKKEDPAGEAAEKPVKKTTRKTTKKVEEAVEEAAEKPVKKTTRKTTKKAAEAVEEPAEKPVKKAAKKTAAKKETTKKGPAKSEKAGTAE